MTAGRLAILLTLAAALFAAIGVLYGAHGPDLPQVLDGLDQTERTILLMVRLPSVLLAIIVGAALSVSGALMQTYFRNPLAEPYVTGVSAGGALGAVITVSLGLQGPLAVALASIAGGALITAALYIFALRRRRPAAMGVLLLGVALGTLCGSLVWFILLKQGPAQTESAIAWLLGSLRSFGYSEVLWLAPLVVAGIAVALFYVPELDALLLGEEKAGSLGVEILAARRGILAAATLLAAVCVAFCGVIAFVGLMVPHVVRSVVGARHLRVLPLSALGGAALLLAIDFGARMLNPPGEIPVTVLTSMLGAPFFIFVLLRSREVLV